jgi:hypothetical protein
LIADQLWNSGSELARQPLCAARVHQHSRALEIFWAPQTRREDEMAFQERVCGAEFGKDLVVGHVSERH